MRFLMLNWRDPLNPQSGGAERVSLGYFSALAKRGHETFWFSNTFPGANESDTVEGVRIFRGGGVGSSILRAREWYRRQAPFNLVVDQHHGIPWYAPWWCGANTVAYIHEVLGPIWNAFYGWPWNVIGRSQERWTHALYRNVQFWTACESTRDALEAHGVKNIKIIRYGVHTRALPELPPKALQSPLGLVCVSRLAPNKRIDHAIQALSVLRHHGVDAQLTVVGGGDCERALREQTHSLQLDRFVIFSGPLPEAQKDAILRDAHFLLHTSQREGWGLNVIEANAMGTPAVVYPVEGLKESTLHEVTGLVAKSETPEALADALQGALQRPEVYQRWREAAWERARLFHWDAILPPACDWLEEMARRRR